MSETRNVARSRPQGLWAPALTALDEDLAPDAGRTVAHVRRLLDEGCHGVALFGTTGEATSFSVDERKAVLEATLEAGVPAGRLMVGTGCCALTDSLELTRHAAALGCKQVLMLPPFYYKGVSDEGLHAAYAEVIERTGDPALEVILYHFPRLSAVPITHGLVESVLTAYPGTIAGIKDSSGDPEGCAHFIARFPDLGIFPGTEAIMLDMLEKGAAGCISASANVNAPAIRRVWDAWQAGREDREALQDEITATRLVLQANPMIPTLKQILAHRLGDSAWLRLRPPLTTLTGAQAAQLETELARLGFGLAAA
ncbi:MAG: dihydrodipicolinate synthase family protein [Rhodospirillales bacterium]|nr:dihydrodipicolinate synthase family protein [Rhodospirillales bacterium]MDH3913149.1 dihydrodipicolinate synthase family protein [Rhodospirillales bacterium]MDH3965482.1 dihydrodipicolinate synthase family protein [Rhodospirillales bacterium]